MKHPIQTPIQTLHTALVITTLAGCAALDVGDPSDDELRIINGVPAPSTVHQYAATIGIHSVWNGNTSSEPFCSGTLIRPNVVLTAAHCCDEAMGWGGAPDPMEPDEAMIYVGDGGGDPGEFFPLSQVLIYPGYDRMTIENDLCLLRLATPAIGTPSVPHLPASLALTNADIGLSLDYAGFGYSDLAMTQYGEKLHIELPLGGMGCSVPGCPAGAPVDTQFSYVMAGDPVLGPCNGDSGGPTFVDRGGTIYVAGLTSYGDAGCEIYGSNTHVAPFQTFIDHFVAAAGHGGSTCGDGVCSVGESCDGRSGTVACGADCPGQTNGNPAAQYCWVGGLCEGPGC